MKKILIAILFVLIVIPVNAQSVKEEIEFYGHSMTYNYQMFSIAGDHQTVQFLSNGDITCVPGNYRVQMKPYYGRTDIFGEAVSGNNLRFRCSQLPAIEVVIDKEKTLMLICCYTTSPLTTKSIRVYSTSQPNGSSPSPGYVPTPSPSPNYNSTTPSQGRTCAGCHGTGICTMCQGKGGYYTNSGTYTGSGSKTWHQCSSCHGSGKCGVCYGQGTIR